MLPQVHFSCCGWHPLAVSRSLTPPLTSRLMEANQIETGGDGKKV
jgi:hypothetical protein